MVSLSLTNMKLFLKNILGGPSRGQPGKAHGHRMQVCGLETEPGALDNSVVSLGTCHPRLVSGPTYVNSADVVVTPNTWTVTVLVALLGLSAVPVPWPLASHTPAPQSFLGLGELQTLGQEGSRWSWEGESPGAPEAADKPQLPSCQQSHD